MDIGKDRPVFLRVFNPPLCLIGLGITLEIDHDAAVFLQGEDFFTVVSFHLVGSYHVRVSGRSERWGGGDRQPVPPRPALGQLIPKLYSQEASFLLFVPHYLEIVGPCFPEFLQVPQ